MRIAWPRASVLLAASIVSLGCHGSKGKANAPVGTGGQGGAGVSGTQGSEGGTTTDAGLGGTAGAVTTARGGSTGASSTASGGVGGTSSGGTAGVRSTTNPSIGGGMSVGGVPSGPPVAVEDFVDAWTTAACDAVEPCCQASEYGWSRSSCVSSMADLVKADVAGAAIAGVAWDAQAAGKCIAGMKRDFAGCNPPINLDLYDACRSILVGSKAPGEACTNSLQCTAPANGQGQCTSTRTDGGAGYRQVCTVETSMNARGKLGDPCRMDCRYSDIKHVSCFGNVGPAGDAGADAPISANCFVNDGLHCDPKTLTCVSQGTSGSACKNNIDCISGLACVSSKCAPPPGLGASCALSSLACAPGLYCDRHQFVCKEGLPDGASCGSSPDLHCQSGWCLCSPTDNSNCACGPLPRWGTVSSVQCTGKLDLPAKDAGVSSKG